MIRPETEAELAEVVAGATGPFRIIGGGTRDYGRPVAGADLSAAGLSGITLYEPGALTMVARAGTSLAEIEAALARENQRLPFEPTDLRGLLGTTGTPTIGGVFATNASGPRRVQVGAARDFLLGVRYVDGKGAVVKNGGRVMKNVTGYDLVKLMAGSYGTLGVMTEVSFKVLPAPEAAVTLTLPVSDPSTVISALSAAVGSPFDVSGAAWADGQVLIRVEGFSASVAYRADRLSALLAPFGAVEAETDAAAVARHWAAIRDVAPFARAPGDVWRLSCRPSQAAALVAQLGAEDVILDWAGGLVWARVAPGTDLRQRLTGFTGHATLVRAATETRGAIPSFHPEPPAVAALSKGLRAKFDPKGLFNPGIMD